MARHWPNDRPTSSPVDTRMLESGGQCGQLAGATSVKPVFTRLDRGPNRSSHSGMFRPAG